MFPQSGLRLTLLLFGVVLAAAAIFPDRAAPPALPQTAEGYSGDAARVYERAIDYEKGIGGAHKDTQEAVRLYRLAADQGYPKVQAALGFFYEQGMGGLDKDEAEAARQYRLAADQGNARGQYNLAVYYEEGRGGMPKDGAEAVRLY